MKSNIQNKPSSPKAGSRLITFWTRPESNKTTLFQIICLLLLVPLIVGCSGEVMKEQSVRNSVIGSGSAKMMPSIAMGAPAMMDEAMVESYERYDSDDKMMLIEPMPPYPGNEGEGELVIDRKVIKTARLSVEVQDYETAAIKVINLAQKYSGFVADSNSYTDKNGKKRGHVNIRIPSLHFDAALIETGSFGEVKSQTLSGDDVTENYMDTVARLNNSKREEVRMLEILDKAENVNELLRIERELARVRGDVERAQGRLNYLDNHVSYSTLHVELYEPVSVVKESGIYRAFKDGVNLFMGTLRFMIRALGLLLPFIVIAVAIVVLVVVLRKRSKRRRRK